MTRVGKATPPVRSRGGTRGSTRRPPDDARTSILAAAEQLFYREGIRAVGVDAVADAAGVTKRTLYYHFASKDDLVAAYLEVRDEATRVGLHEAAGDPTLLPGDRILEMFAFVARWAATPEYRGCPFNNAVAEYGTSDQVTAVARRHKSTMQRWFTERGVEAGAADPDELGARLLVLLDGALNGAAVFASAAPVHAARAIAESVLDAAGVARTREAGTKAGRR